MYLRNRPKVLKYLIVCVNVYSGLYIRCKTLFDDFCYSGAYNLESFLDLGSSRNYDVPNVQPDEGCSIQFTSVSKTDRTVTLNRIQFYY